MNNKAIVHFWEREAEKLPWFKRWDTALDWQEPFAHWFAGGMLNASYACLDIHYGTTNWHKPAVIWEDEQGSNSQITYEQLFHEVNTIATLLQKNGVKTGDIVVLYLPMIPQAITCMLALARIGAPHVVVFSGFSAKALAERIRDTNAVMVITADNAIRRGKTIPLTTTVTAALAECEKPVSVLVINRAANSITITKEQQSSTVAWPTQPNGLCTPVAVESNHPLFVLYTSGTTGKPKGIVHSTGGYLTHVKSSFQTAFAPKDTDVYWCTADIGWITGHSYVVYAPLMHGCTIFMYEGAPDYPHLYRWWELIERHKITIFYTAPTALRMAMKSDTTQIQSYNLSSLRLLGSVGEPINPTVWQWFFDCIGQRRCPIIDTWWQTETGGFMIAPQATTPIPLLKPGSATRPLPGIAANIVDVAGNKVPVGTKGYLVITQPWPGMTIGILNDPTRFAETYWSKFPHYFNTNDYAIQDKDGYFWLLGRADEILNIAGHCIGTAEIEHTVLQHPAIAEAAAIRVTDEIKGENVIVFVVLKSNQQPYAELSQELNNYVRTGIGSFASPKEIRIAQSLPKTRSGKIMRRVLSAQVAGKPLGDLSTLEDEQTVQNG